MTEAGLAAGAAGLLGALGAAAWWTFGRPPIPREVPQADRDLFRATYGVARREMGPAAWGHFPPGLHRFDAGTYAAAVVLIRDVYLADAVVLERQEREVLATAVSVSNQCYFCSHNHAALTRAAHGAPVARAVLQARVENLPTERLRQIALFGLRSKEPSASILRDPPFTSDEVADAAAIVFSFHYVNRVLDALGPTGLQGEVMAKPPAPLIARMLGLRRSISPMALDTLRQAGVVRPVEVSEADRANVLRWSAGRPPTADAVLFAWSSIQQSAREVLGERVMHAIRHHLESWNGEPPPLFGYWTEEAVGVLDDAPELQALARQGLVIARAPERIDRGELWQAAGRSRRTRTVLASYAAFAAALRIMQWQPVARTASTAPSQSDTLVVEASLS